MLYAFFRGHTESPPSKIARMKESARCTIVVLDDCFRDDRMGRERCDWAGRASGSVDGIQRLPSLSLFLAQPLFKLGHECRKVRAEHEADGTKLDQVEAAFADLDLADEGLALPDFLGEFDLRETRRLPGLSKKFEQDGVLRSPDGFVHAAPCEAKTCMVKSRSD